MTKRIAGFLLVLLLLAASAPAAAWGEAASPAASLPSVTIGGIGQPIGNVTITENVAGALSSTVTYSTTSSVYQVAEPVTTNSPAILRLLLPPGVSFTSTPTVSVTSGDLQIGEVASDQLPGDQGYLDIRIVRSSTVPSVIEVSGIELTLDRTVPEGQIILRIRGTAVDQTQLPPEGLLANPEQENSLFQNAVDAAAFPVALCVTPAAAGAPGPRATVFKIGESNYTTANGTAAMLEVAPYIKGGRFMVPLQALSEAAGLPAGIAWNPAGSVTVTGNNSAIKLTIGSKTIQVNGTGIDMDVAPEIVSGRTIVPISWLAKALGLNAVWDGAAQTVTVTAAMSGDTGL